MPAEWFIWVLARLILGAAIIVMIIRTMAAAKKAAKPDAADVKERPEAAQRLSEAIKIKSISNEDESKVDWQAFEDFRHFLKKRYPNIHSRMTLDIVGGYSLFYSLEGSDPSLKPVLLMGHMDVVPEGDEENWQHPPFSGRIADGYIWGRGAIDMKGIVVAIFEALEEKLSNGDAPQRGICVALGHNEETAHESGAIETAKMLKDRGYEFEFIMDEGGAFMDGAQFGADGVFGLIGLCEKGYSDIRIIARSNGGHASRPPKNTAAGEVARAVCNLEKRPMEARLTPVVRSMIESMGPAMRFPFNVMAANLWLFAPVFKHKLSKSRLGNAFIRTTSAVTMLSGSSQANVLPDVADAVINARLLPGDSTEDVIRHIAKRAAGLEIEPITLNAASPSADVGHYGYKQAAKALEYATGCRVAPYIMTGGTDSRFYQSLSDCVIRCTPFVSYKDDGHTMHAANERLEISSFYMGIEFYSRLIKKCCYEVEK
ncbi:MAG: M20/M25/M40 family metallo-hydrolase [Christensenellales bacterium]|jgi:carboxypeptidase PM20D1